jgi:hypothetical protein
MPIGCQKSFCCRPMLHRRLCGPNVCAYEAFLRADRPWILCPALFANYGPVHCHRGLRELMRTRMTKSPSRSRHRTTLIDKTVHEGAVQGRIQVGSFAPHFLAGARQGAYPISAASSVREAVLGTWPLAHKLPVHRFATIQQSLILTRLNEIALQWQDAMTSWILACEFK